MQRKLWVKNLFFCSSNGINFAHAGTQYMIIITLLQMIFENLKYAEPMRTESKEITRDFDLRQSPCFYDLDRKDRHFCDVSYIT